MPVLLQVACEKSSDRLSTAFHRERLRLMTEITEARHTVSQQYSSSWLCQLTA